MADKAGDDELESLFEKLDGCLSTDQYKKGLKLCAEILKRKPADPDALKCNALLLVKSDQYAEALVFLKKHQKLEAELAFERAYCLYCLRRYDEALSLLQSADTAPSEAVLQLKAQLLYRTDKGVEALAAFQELAASKQVQDEEAEDDQGFLLTNLVAAAVLAGKPAEGEAAFANLPRGAQPRFEAVFNRACCSLALERPEDAHEQLVLAQRLGQEALYEEEFTEAEVENELAIITAQLAYTYSRLGQLEDSSQTYNTIVSSKNVTGETVAPLCWNNIFADRLSLHSTKKLLAEALKKLEGLMDKADRLKLRSDLDKRLGESQKLTVRSNYAVLLVLNGKGEQGRTLLGALQAQYGASHPSLLLLQASFQALSGKGVEADATLAKLAQSHPDLAQRATLARAQIAVAHGNPRGGLAILQQLNAAALANRPAVVASCVGLLSSQGETRGAEGVLQAALEHWNGRKGDERDSGLEWLLQQLATLKLKTGDVEAALNFWKQLQQLTGVTAGGLKVLSRLAGALALSQPEAAAELQQYLPPLSVNLDAQELEQAALADMPRRQQPSGILRQRGAITDDSAGAKGPGQRVAGKKRSRKKKRYPKNFDPENPGPLPDPERWLPKWQRSDYKRRRTSRHRQKEVVKGSQGAGKVDESLDISSAAGAAKHKSSAGPQLPAKLAKGKGKGRR